MTNVYQPRETEFIRVGSYKKKLKDFPEKERALWALLGRTPFEKGLAATKTSSNEVLALLDYPKFFELAALALPSNKAGILDRLTQERMLARASGDRYDITNLVALLFAKKLSDFDSLARKAVRVIKS